MSAAWTHVKLAALSVHDRAKLYSNACRLGDTAEGADLKQRIEDVGLPYSEDAALKEDDPITRKMIKIIYSPEGRAAALKGQSEGLPPPWLVPTPFSRSPWDRTTAPTTGERSRQARSRAR